MLEDESTKRGDGASGHVNLWKTSVWAFLAKYFMESGSLAKYFMESGSGCCIATIFTDAQAAIWRMISDDPGPGQKYALEARRHIAALRAKEANARIEIRWCPSHQGIEGNEVADKWAKLAADEPDAHEVEWFSTTNPDGSVSERKSPLPRSFANVKHGFSKQKRADAMGWARKQLARTSNRKYRPSEKKKPDPTVAKANKRLAFPLLLDEDGALPNRPVSRVDHPPTGRRLLVVSVQDPDSGTPVQELPTMEEPAEHYVGNRS